MTTAGARPEPIEPVEVDAPPLAPADPPVRFGILGGARINRRLVPTFGEARGAELIGMASRSADRAREKAAEWGCRAFDSYDDLLASPDIDAVYIPLPNGLHAEWCVRAIEAGKMVLCEKALVTSLDEIARIRAAIAANNGWLEETVQYRHHPLTERARSAFSRPANGTAPELGRTLAGKSHFDFILEKENIRWDRALGGGVSLDLGIYCVSVWRAVLGEQPIAARATRVVWADGPTGPIDLEVAGELTFANGFTAKVSYSYRRPLSVGWTLVAENATLHSPHDFAYNVHDDQPEQELWLYDGAGPAAPGRRFHAPDSPLRDRRAVWRASRVASSYTLMVEECASRWRRGEAPRFGIDEAEANLRVLLALLESSRRDNAAVDPVRL